MSKDTTGGTGSETSTPENMPSRISVHENAAQLPEKPGHTPFDMNVVISWILQGGVLISAAVVCVGLLLLFLHPEQLSDQQFLVFPHSLGQIKDGLLQLQPQAFVALGLLLLVATPVMRVAISILAFALEHDRRYVVITCIVLAILLISFLSGKGGS